MDSYAALGIDPTDDTSAILLSKAQQQPRYGFTIAWDSMMAYITLSVFPCKTTRQWQETHSH